MRTMVPYNVSFMAVDIDIIMVLVVMVSQILMLVQNVIIGTKCHYWSTTENPNNTGVAYLLDTSLDSSRWLYIRDSGGKTWGYSIRLFRNSDDRGYDPGVSLSSSSIQLGWVVAENGKVYQTLALANQFSTAVAMVAYIGSASDCSHGLAYALTDMGPMYRAAAATSVNGYTPVVAGGSWRLPTKADYKYMFAASDGCGDGCGGTCWVTLAPGMANTHP